MGEAWMQRSVVDQEAQPVVTGPVTAEAARTPVTAASLAGRNGFDEQFLGKGELRVPLPTVGAATAKNLVTVSPRQRGTRKYLLHYTHFSVATHAERRVALFTAVNIDGSLMRLFKRHRDVWSFDPRLDEKFQTGEELYEDNDLDRGHLVRRLDPAWGDVASAKAGEEDSFFFTNCSAQHSSFNQRTWLSLEDYLLRNADTLDFRASVFTGPVLTDSDPEHRGFRLPQAFWKVAVMRRTEDGALSATGYTVSQSDLLTDLEFAFGQFKTHQVPVAQIESLTGLGFGTMKDADPLGSIEGVDGASRELRAADDITI
jgi:endonuclease G, mitochondrial